jgi:hypothetical protein
MILTVAGASSRGLLIREAVSTSGASPKKSEPAEVFMFELHNGEEQISKKAQLIVLK